MPKIISVFSWGLMISFLGSLPLGTLNVAAMQISIQEGIADAMYFSFGSLIVEMVYVRISLVGIDWVRKQDKLMRVMEWITLLVIIALAFGSFWAAFKEGGGKNIMLNNQMHRLLLGMFMSAINPVQIPFWFGWSSVLFSKKILEPVGSQYNAYIIGIGAGTLMGNAIFIFGGKWLVSRMEDSGKYINWVIGSIFLITAIVQVWKMMKRKPAL